MTQAPPIPFEERDAISQRAGELFERRRFGDWSDADQAELEAWCAESALHRMAYLRLEGIFAHTERLAAHRPFRSAAISSGRTEEKSYRFRVLPLLAAASIAVVAFAYPTVISLLQPPDRSLSTDIGDHTLLKFSDGTEIELNTNTAMRYRMTTAARIVWLDRGEAWFHVAHNAANPFTVVIGKHHVTDLGTEFIVRRGSDESDGTEVTLLNGRAELSTAGAQTAVLKPGDDAIATPVSLSVTRKTPQQLADALAWRRGMLVFRKAKLADVAREFNRYNSIKLVIADPSVADQTITANARTDDYETILRLAEVELNLRVDREGNQILISRGSREKNEKSRAR